jgi:hypothetical protein
MNPYQCKTSACVSSELMCNQTLPLSESQVISLQATISAFETASYDLAFDE